MTRLYGLYAITDEKLIPTKQFDLAVESALKGGASIIQYRDKSKDTQKRFTQAQTLCRLCRRYKAVSIINDDIELAASVGADGVHLGRDDTSLILARRLLGKDAIIGVSCYNDISLALKAEKNTADYVAFGAMFASTTKPDAPVAGLDIIASAKSQLTIPICTIGGISKNNIKQVIQRGADITAVVSGIFCNEDIKASTETLNQHFLTTR